jgi:hypothetical protein
LGDLDDRLRELLSGRRGRDSSETLVVLVACDREAGGIAIDVEGRSALRLRTQHGRGDGQLDRIATKDADRELTVVECGFHPAAEAGGQIEFSFVTPVLPLVDEKLSRRGAAYMRPETQGGGVARMQLNPDVACSYGGKRRYDDERSSCLVHVDRNTLRIHHRFRGHCGLDNVVA